MIWAKLFVSVFIMSDSGAVATTAFTVDLEMSHCQRLLPEFNRKQELQKYGHAATITVKSYCEPTGGPHGFVTSNVPPPVAGMLNGFLQGLQ